MLTWIKIQTEDVVPYLAGDQVQLLRTRSIEEGKDPLIAIVLDVAAYIRGLVPSPWRRNPVDPDQIPIECRMPACFLAVEALQSRLPELPLSADQVRNGESARQILKMLANLWQTEAGKGSPKGERCLAVRFRKDTVNHKTLGGL
ncbi:MAG: hypothetical protein LBR62_02440 [Puniceicoccales bacterium]|jgi:hypothetical protein|nr:hypothetical protein [Puniceicoccales bacterium]